METRYGVYLEKSGLFKGIPKEKYSDVLSCLRARCEEYPVGAAIVNAGDQSFRAGIVLEGNLEEYIYGENANQVVIGHLRSGAVFGAELVCGSTGSSQFYLEASEKSKVLLLDFGNLLSEQTLRCPWRMRVTSNLLQEMANQVIYFNTKVRILSQKKLRDKIKVYLQTLEITNDGVISLPFTRNKLAEFLNVDRSALSRELCRMRDDGILTFSGSKIRILESDFLSS